MVVGAVSVVVLTSSGEDMPEDLSRKPDIDNLEVDDYGAEVVEGYTCGKKLVHACSPLGGYCKEVSSSIEKEAAKIFGGDAEYCKCRNGYDHKSSSCDWGPPSSMEEDDTWTEAQLKRVKLSYDASNLAYEIVNSDWISYDGKWKLDEGHAFGSVDNGNSSAVIHMPQKQTTFPTIFTLYTIPNIMCQHVMRLAPFRFGIKTALVLWRLTDCHGINSSSKTLTN